MSEHEFMSQEMHEDGIAELLFSLTPKVNAEMSAQILFAAGRRQGMLESQQRQDGRFTMGKQFWMATTAASWACFALMLLQQSFTSEQNEAEVATAIVAQTPAADHIKQTLPTTDPLEFAELPETASLTPLAFLQWQRGQEIGPQETPARNQIRSTTPATYSELTEELLPSTDIEGSSI